MMYYTKYWYILHHDNFAMKYCHEWLKFRQKILLVSDSHCNFVTIVNPMYMLKLNLVELKEIFPKKIPKLAYTTMAGQSWILRLVKITKKKWYILLGLVSLESTWRVAWNGHVQENVIVMPPRAALFHAILILALCHSTLNPNPKKCPLLGLYLLRHLKDVEGDYPSKAQQLKRWLEKE